MWSILDAIAGERKRIEAEEDYSPAKATSMSSFERWAFSSVGFFTYSSTESPALPAATVAAATAELAIVVVEDEADLLEVIEAEAFVKVVSTDGIPVEMLEAEPFVKLVPIDGIVVEVLEAEAFVKVVPIDGLPVEALEAEAFVKVVPIDGLPVEALEAEAFVKVVLVDGIADEALEPEVFVKVFSVDAFPGLVAGPTTLDEEVFVVGFTTSVKRIFVLNIDDEADDFVVDRDVVFASGKVALRN